MFEVLYRNEFEANCRMSYRHGLFCNNGQNSLHLEAPTEETAGREVGFCYGFGYPCTPLADKGSFRNHDMDTGGYGDDRYAGSFDGCQEERDEALEALWEEFGEIPMNPETECMEADWKIWKAGTHREEIWHWFDERHSIGVAALMQGIRKSGIKQNHTQDS